MTVHLKRLVFPLKRFKSPSSNEIGIPLRLDSFGWANHLGLLAGLLLVLLLVLWSDWSLTRLGARRRWRCGAACGKGVV